MMAGEFIRVGDTLLAIGEIAAVQRNRHQSGWSTVVLQSGVEVAVARPAGELIDDIRTVLTEAGLR